MNIISLFNPLQFLAIPVPHIISETGGWSGNEA